MQVVGEMSSANGSGGGGRVKTRQEAKPVGMKFVIKFGHLFGKLGRALSRTESHEKCLSEASTQGTQAGQASSSSQPLPVEDCPQVLSATHCQFHTSAGWFPLVSSPDV